MFGVVIRGILFSSVLMFRCGLWSAKDNGFLYGLGNQWGGRMLAAMIICRYVLAG